MAMSSRTNRRWTSRSIESEPCWAQDLLKLSSYNPQQTVPSVDHFRFQDPSFHGIWGGPHTHSDWEKAKQRLYFQIRKFNLQPALPPSSLSCAHQPQSRTGPDCNQQRGSSVLIFPPPGHVQGCSANQKNKLNKVDSDCGSLKEAECEHNPLNRLVASLHSWENCFVKSECHFEETHSVQYCSESLFVSNLGETVVLF